MHCEFQKRCLLTCGVHSRLTVGAMFSLRHGSPTDLGYTFTCDSSILEATWTTLQDVVFPYHQTTERLGTISDTAFGGFAQPRSTCRCLKSCMRYSLSCGETVSKSFIIRAAYRCMP